MRRFVTPRTEVQAAKILSENFRAMDPELGKYLDEQPLDLGVVVLPEAITNPYQPSLLDRANILIGKVMMSGVRPPRQELTPNDEEDAWNNLLGR